MSRTKRLLAALPAVSLGAAALALTQVLRAAHRSDLPSFPNQDISGTFGHPDDPPLRIVAVGDSSLTIPGVEDPDNAWIRAVALEFACSHRVELISLGVGGSKAQDVIEGQLEAAVELAGDIAVVSVGANDAIRGVPAERFRERLEHIVTRLEETAGAVVVLGMGDGGSVPRLPRMIRPYLTRRTFRFNDVCREVALRHPRTVKVHTRGAIRSAFWEDRGLFAEDLFHAGDRGHRLFARESLAALGAAYTIATGRPAPLPETIPIDPPA